VSEESNNNGIEDADGGGMPQTVKHDHFSTGVWSADSKGPELRHFTCVLCGHRAKTLESWRGHRKTCESTPQNALPRPPGLDTESSGVV
jgi:hypothetical protein